ncbi:MAG: dihydroorotate dehydrogenase-like protein [Spirochaetaceae bacterium]|nr:dihydroorotate dehydrogenase-like protein [Spirochaetaceae bacterium]
MANLDTQFLGLTLSSPIIIGSSGLTGNTANICKLAEAGAGAVVLKSIFEEQILASIAREVRKGGVIYGQEDVDEFIAYYERMHSINDYMALIRETKKSVSIPVVASINATSDKEWQAICADLTEAGADALQLNLFISPFDTRLSSDGIEETYYSVVRKVRALTPLPLAVKIGPFFTNLGRLAAGLGEAGAGATVLFNRYSSPDIDVKGLSMKTGSSMSSDTEYLSALRWTALLSRSAGTQVVAATGIHDGTTVIKLLLAGARAVEVVSTVYKNGESRIREMNDGIAKWMDEKSYTSIDAFRGTMSGEKVDDARIFERVQYMKRFGDI